MMRSLALCTATAVSCLAAAAPAFAQVEKPNVKMSLDWAFQGPQSVFLYGLEKGEFKKEGIDMQIDRGTGSGDTIVRVASGAYDFGWADLATMIKFNAENPGKELIAVYVSQGNSPLAVMTVEGRGIKSPKDLEGKKLGSTAGSAAFALFPAFAVAAGFDASKITWQTLSGQLREPMMVRGDVDAVAGFDSSSILTIVDLGVPRDKVVTLYYNASGVKQYGAAIVTRPGYAKDNPKTTAAVVRAVNAAFKDAIANPKASTATIKARDPIAKLETECQRLLEGLENNTLSEGFKKDGLGAIDDIRLKASIDETVTAFKLKEAIPADKVYTAAFMPPQAERMPPALGSCK